MQGHWHPGSGAVWQSKGCMVDCNYSCALSPPPESEGGGRRGSGLD